MLPVFWPFVGGPGGGRRAAIESAGRAEWWETAEAHRRSIGSGAVPCRLRLAAMLEIRRRFTAAIIAADKRPIVWADGLGPPRWFRAVAVNAPVAVVRVAAYCSPVGQLQRLATSQSISGSHVD